MSPEHGDRQAFLAPVRARAGTSKPFRPVEPADDPGLISYSVDTSDLVAAFTRAVEAVAGYVRLLGPGDEGMRVLLAELSTTGSVRRAVVSNDPECASVGRLLVELGVEVVPITDRALAASADLGVTGAARGIALTGTLVVDSARAGSRTASLLPPVHLALLDRSLIVATPGDVLRRFSGAGGGDLPSNLVLITGPSRSADIELEITLGVHGPRALWVGLL